MNACTKESYKYGYITLQRRHTNLRKRSMCMERKLFLTHSRGTSLFKYMHLFCRHVCLFCRVIFIFVGLFCTWMTHYKETYLFKYTDLASLSLTEYICVGFFCRLRFLFVGLFCTRMIHSKDTSLFKYTDLDSGSLTQCVEVSERHFSFHMCLKSTSLFKWFPTCFW